MTENQAKKRGRGRPLNIKKLDIPKSMSEALEKSTFFNFDLGRKVRWRGLPDASAWDRKYRLRAAVKLIIDRGFRPNMSEKYLTKSWKQISRYLDGEDAPTSFIDALAIVADISEAWLLSGDASVNARVADAFEAMQHHAPLQSPPMIDRIVAYEGAEDARHSSENVSQKDNAESGDLSEITNKKQSLTELREPTQESAQNFVVQPRYYEVGMRIKEAVREAGGDAAVKLRGGIAVGTLNNAQSGTNLPSTETLIKLSAATGRSIDWMLTGCEQQTYQVPDDFTAVPLLPEAVSAGDGREASANDGEAADHVLFRREFLRSLSVNPQKAALLTVRGDSMEPTLSSGDLILADTGDQDISTAGVFVISVDGSAMVKRLMRRGDGSVMVISDNQQLYPPETVAADRADLFRVIGRVRWYGRAVR